MGLWTLIRRSLRHYMGANLAVGLAVATAVAVLVGSLTVGDSVQASLRRLALERLGRAEFALASQDFFGEHLAEDALKALPAEVEGIAAPIIFVPGSARVPTARGAINHVNVIGVSGTFWKLWSEPGLAPTDDVCITGNLAAELGATVGDAIVISFKNPSRTPIETVFAHTRRSDVVATARVTVTRVLAERDAGVFTLRGDQSRPRNVYMGLAQLQDLLKEPGQVNTVLVGSSAESATLSIETLRSAARSALTLDDLGLTITPDSSGKRILLKSRRLVLNRQMVATAERAAKEAGCVAEVSSVYMANTLAKSGSETKSIPYSIVAGVSAADGRGLGPNEIVLNRWAADDLGVAPGDMIEASFFVAGENGELATTKRAFKLVGVVTMDSPDVDARMVPDFEGMTPSESMTDWKTPFPIDHSRIRPQDENYWKTYRTTPKAFVSTETCRALWEPAPTRALGWVTCVSLSPSASQDPAIAAERFSGQLLRGVSLDQAGIDLRAVKADALESARSTQDFGMLFLSMSAFLVAAAVALIVLLMRLAIERRSRQVGIMLAMGFSATAVRRALVGEALVVLLAAGMAGMPMGVLYAALIVKALGSFWSGAVGGFPLAVTISVPALLMGAASGVAVALLAVFFSLRRLGRIGALQLLKGWQEPPVSQASPSRRLDLLGVLCLAVAAALWILSAGVGLISPSIAFFLSGSVCMTGAILIFAGLLRRRASSGRAARTPTIWRLALAGASRNRTRSILTVALLACASFIIVTVATFGRDPSRTHPGPKDSPTGGFNLVVTTDIPVFQNIGAEAGCEALGLSTQTTSALAQAEVIPLRMSTGEDISCLNIQRATTPRVVGVSEAMILRGGFPFSEGSSRNPWGLLQTRLEDKSTPAFTDTLTAQWNLHKGLGESVSVPMPTGRTMNCRLVGLFSESIFAGEIIISEDAFREHFGTETGYRMFLIRTGTDLEAEKKLAGALRDELGDFGVTVTPTGELLASYARVQNTYLSTFQTLGGLGLLLGTFGLVTVLLRNVLDRRSELAMMLAVGFRRGQLVRMVLLESVSLLVVGLAVGTLGALVGAVPQLLATQTHVNWPELAAMLAVIVAVGSACCVAAVGASVRTGLLAALRAE